MMLFLHYDAYTVWDQGTETGVFKEQKFLTKMLYITQLVRLHARSLSLSCWF